MQIVGSNEPNQEMQNPHVSADFVDGKIAKHNESMSSASPSDDYRMY